MNVPFAPLVLSLLANAPAESLDLIGSVVTPAPLSTGIDSCVKDLPRPLLSLLEELEGSGSACVDPTELAEQLIARGPELLGEMHVLLSTVYGQSGHPLTAKQTAVLDSVVIGLGRTSVVSFVDSLAAGDNLVPAQRQSAIKLLGLVGLREELTTALALTGASMQEPLDAMLRQPLLETIQAMLENDPGAQAEIPSLALQLDPTAASPLVRAVGAVGSVEAWDTLNDLLGGNTQLDRVTLSTIRELAQRWPGTAPEHMTARVVMYLTDVDTMLVRNALQALGALDVQDLHQELIDLLDHDEPSVASEAYSTLTQVTGLSLPADPARWQVWMKSEQAWWLLEAETLFMEIDGGQLTEQCAALQTLSRHRMHRNETADRILSLLARESPQLRGAACDALANLGAMVAVPPLEDLRDAYAQGHPAHESALRALVVLLGVEAREVAD